MKNEELISYLSEFKPDSEVSVVIVDLSKRIRHKIGGCMLLIDTEAPALLFETDGTGPLDEVLEGI